MLLTGALNGILWATPKRRWGGWGGIEADECLEVRILATFEKLRACFCLGSFHSPLEGGEGEGVQQAKITSMLQE